MRIVLPFLCLLWSGTGVRAESAGHDAVRAAVEACDARPAAERAPCVEAALAPTPEQAARLAAGQQWTHAYNSRIASALAASGAARELAFAATLQRVAGWSAHAMAGAGDERRIAPSDPRVDAWWRDAAALAGDDVLAWTLLVQDDARMREQAATRWQTLEPDNLAAWLAGNPIAEALLAAAARATYYDSHFYPRVRWRVSALRAYPPSASEAQALLATRDSASAAFDPEEFAAIAAFASDMVVAMPVLQPLMHGCRGEALAATPTRRAECRHAADIMANRSDSMLAESVGIALLKETAESDGERAQAAQRRRRFDWQMYQRMDLDVDSQRGTGRFLRLFRDPSLRNERDLTERMLREAGVPLDPPVGWTMPMRGEFGTTQR